MNATPDHEHRSRAWWLRGISAVLQGIAAVYRHMTAKTVSPLGLDVFRIVYGSILFCEIQELYRFRHMVFDELPYFITNDISFGPVLIAWMVALACLVLGLFTQTAAVVNYVLTLLTFSTFHDYEYHMDFVYTGTNLLLMFVPIGKRLSLDSLLRRFRSGGTDELADQPVSYANYYSLMLVGLAVVYFDSVFYKFVSPVWQQGLGLWRPASMPPFSWQFTPVFLLEQKWLMVLLSHITLVLESVFIFAMWFRWGRLIMLPIGATLHLGIALAFPLPWFGLAMASLYILLVPPEWWEAIFSKLRNRQPLLTVWYDETSTALNRWRILLEQFDVTRRVEFHGVDPETDPAIQRYRIIAYRGDERFVAAEALRQIFTDVGLFTPLGMLLRIGALRRMTNQALGVEASNEGDAAVPQATIEMAPVREKVAENDASRPKHFDFRLLATILLAGMCAYSQLVITSLSPGALQIAEDWNLQGLHDRIRARAQANQKWFRIVFGSTRHAVFVDYLHYDGYNHTVGLVYQGPDESVRIWLPLIEEDTRTGWFNHCGRVFAKWNWRDIGTKIDADRLAAGTKKVTAFWVKQSGLRHLDDIKFSVMVKRLDTPNGWEPNFYRRQQEKSWQEAGTVEWKDGEFIANIRDIESM